MSSLTTCSGSCHTSIITSASNCYLGWTYWQFPKVLTYPIKVMACGLKCSLQGKLLTKVTDMIRVHCFPLINVEQQRTEQSQHYSLLKTFDLGCSFTALFVSPINQSIANKKSSKKVLFLQTKIIKESSAKMPPKKTFDSFSYLHSL